MEYPHDGCEKTCRRSGCDKAGQSRDGDEDEARWIHGVCVLFQKFQMLDLEKLSVIDWNDRGFEKGCLE